MKPRLANSKGTANNLESDCKVAQQSCCEGARAHFLEADSGLVVSVAKGLRQMSARCARGD